MALIPIVLLALVVLCIWQFLRARRLPPGPFSFPLLGNLPQIFIGANTGKSAVQLLLNWKKQFGGVYTIWLGPIPAVMVCQFETMMEEFVKKNDPYLGRWQSYLVMAYRGKNGGIIFADGAKWQQQRRFSLHVLRDFGFGRNLMQERIMEEVTINMDKLEKMIGNDKTSIEMNLNPIFDLMIGSVINRLTLGYRFDDTNKKEFFQLKHQLDDFVTNLGVLDNFIFTEKTSTWPILNKLWQRKARTLAAVVAYLRDRIEKHDKNPVEGEEPLDFVDAYFRAMQKNQNNNKNGDGEQTYFSHEQLAAILLDLWIAGQETTTTTLLWAFIYLIRQPDIQRQVQNELAKVVGHDRDVLLEDRKNLPFTVATINEVQRLASIVTFNVWHKTVEAVELNGYVIPRGTLIAPQMSVLFQDETEFDQPEKFDPTRFLDPIRGKALEQKIIPFGIGKRSCLGESLARAELFLVLTNLLNKFNFEATDQMPSQEPVAAFGQLHRPRPYKCRVSKRIIDNGIVF